jgi:hypothetical protein
MFRDAGITFLTIVIPEPSLSSSHTLFVIPAQARIR